MRDYQAKVNDGGGADSITSTKYGAGEYTSLATENKNSVSRSGQTLAVAAGTSEAFFQQAKAMFINGIAAESFLDSGAANAYVVTPVTGSSGLVFPDAFALLNGAIISFIPANASSGASTLNIGQSAGTLLGTKKILNIGGAAISSGQITTSVYHEFLYDPAADSATGAWIFIGIKRVSAAAAGLYNAYAKYSDVKSTGTPGGTFTAGAWRTRTINTEDSDSAGIGTLSSNQVTLGAGTYVVHAIVPASNVDMHKARLYNITDGSTTLLSSANGSTVLNENIPCYITGKFTIAGSKAFEVQHYCQSTQTTDGFGTAGGFSVDEVYTTLEIWRVNT